MEQISSIATDKRPGTYRITFRKIARAAAAELRVHKKLAIIAYVLYGVAMLLFIFNSHCDNYNYGFPPTYFEPSYWGMSFAVMGVLLTLFDVLSVFRDTSNQQLCDVGMALPIKSSERFFSKLLCLVYIQIAPFIVSVLGGNGIAVLIGAIRFGKLDDETAPMIFAMFFMGLASILFITAITTLCACCCGALAESAYFSYIMMFILNGLPVAFILNILNRSAGLMGSFYMIFNAEGMNIDLGYWGFLFILNASEYMPVVIHAAVGCGISIAVTLLSGLIYKKRDARSVGTPISSKLFFEIMMAGACATVFSLAFMSSDVLWGVLIAGVAYIIINIIVSRAKINVLSFVKWIGKFAVTTAAFTALVIGCIKTGGFGYYSLRPDAVYLEGAKYHIVIDPYTISDRQTIATEALTPEQADEVMKICKKHIQKGFLEVNPIDVIFDSYDLTYVSISASSDERFGITPSPRFMFNYRRYSGYDTERKDGYYLGYSQYVPISRSEANALYEELSQLDYVYEYSIVSSVVTTVSSY